MSPTESWALFAALITVFFTVMVLLVINDDEDER